MMATRFNDHPNRRDEFKVGIVCALDIEKQAIDDFFDTTYNAARLGKSVGDTNQYKVGRIREKNVVLVILPRMGVPDSATSVAYLKNSYTAIELFLLIGICAGVPFRGPDRTRDTETILGDVIICSSIVQTDYGKQYSDGYRRRTDKREVLGEPPRAVRTALVMALSEKEKLHENMMFNLKSIQAKHPGKWNYKSTSQDMLFESSVRHKHYGTGVSCECAHCETQEDSVCEEALQSSCDVTKCAGNHVDQNHLIHRERLEPASGIANYVPEPQIHFGTVASANTVMKSSKHRDGIVDYERRVWRDNVIAIETEGAGMWDDRPCVIIKGVADYADSHKNDIWRAYAAATAASCAVAWLDSWILTDSVQAAPPPPLHQWQQQQNYLQTGGERHSVDAPRATTSLSKVTTLVEPSPCRPKVQLFYTLTQSDLKNGRTRYWDRLTVDGWRKYYSIYEICADLGDKKVHFKNFIHQFNTSTGPPCKVISEYWIKVVPPAERTKGTSLALSQGLVISVLYMLHNFHILRESPPYELPENEFSDWRHANLARFADWTQCLCCLNCGRGWNFIPHGGIWRQSSGTEYHEHCLVDMYLNHNFRDLDHKIAYINTWFSWWNAYNERQKVLKN